MSQEKPQKQPKSKATEKLRNLFQVLAQKAGEDPTHLATQLGLAIDPIEQIIRDLESKTKWLLSNINLLLKLVGSQGQCKGCGLEIYWVRHNNGKKAPYTKDGLNHFADCKVADRFRKSKE